MRFGLMGFRLLLCVGWVVLFVISVRAIRQMGAGAAGTIFIGDFAYPWRAQFNTDFTIHLLLAASWMVYRTKSLAIGLICAFLAINLGAVFTLAYLLIVSIRAKGDFAKVLLGDRYPADSPLVYQSGGL